MSEQTAAETTPEPQQADAVTEATTDAETAAPAQEADDDESGDWRKNFNPDIAAKRIEKLQSEAKNLRERAKQAEEKAKGADEKDTTISTLQADNLRLTVGYELGLPLELASRLRGATRDELIEDAKSLVSLVGSPKPAQQRKPIEALRGGGAPEQEPVETDVRKIADRMFNR